MLNQAVGRTKVLLFYSMSKPHVSREFRNLSLIKALIAVDVLQFVCSTSTTHDRQRLNAFFKFLLIFDTMYTLDDVLSTKDNNMNTITTTATTEDGYINLSTDGSYYDA